MIISIGIKDLVFEAIHLTQGFTELDEIPHGHTYRLYVEVSSNTLNEHGYIIDLREIEKVATKIISKLDRSVLVSRDLLNKKSIIKDVFNKIIVIDEVNATIENIARYIAVNIYNDLIKIWNKKLRIRVTLFEGSKYYCVVEYP